MTDLRKEFEKFVRMQVEQPLDTSLAQVLATPYQNDGELAAAYHMFQYAFHLGVRETTAGIFGEDALVKKGNKNA